MLRRITRLIAGVLAAGLLLALAPSASAAAAYDITQVGDADWVGITDADGNDATKTPLASNGANVRVTFGVHIDDMSRLAEGDTVTVPFGAASGSHYGPWGLFGSSNLPRVLRNRDGVDMFTLTAPNAYTLTMTRTGDAAVGSFDGSVTVARQLWMSNGSATSSTWTVGDGHSITFACHKFENSVCGGNTALTPKAKVDNGLVLLSANAMNCGTMRRIAQGRGTDGASPDSLVGWYRITAESGAISKLDLRGYNVRVMFAVDENTPGWWDGNSAVYDLTRISGVDVSTFDKAKADLPVGRIAIERQSDGSWVYAFNLGSRLPGLKNSLQVARAGDEATLKLIDKTGRIWQYAQQISYLHFADESIPNRVKVETQSTESAYRTTTLTTKPLDPAVGAGQSAIRYDPNGGDGDAFRKAGDPGTQATTPEAATFLRKGYAFAGWNTKADGTGVAYKAGAGIAYPAEGQTLTLYAQWEANTYKTEFRDWQGRTITSGTARYGSTPTVPALADTTWLADPDMNFDNVDGWRDDWWHGSPTFTKDGLTVNSRDTRANGKTVGANAAIHVEADADYSEANATNAAKSSGIGFNINNGSNSYQGWNACPNGRQCEVDAVLTAGFASSQTIEPWVQIANDRFNGYGTATVHHMQLTQVDPATHNGLARDGYVFTGWDKDPSKPVEGDTVYTARYRPAVYKVRFDANGGTGAMADQSHTYDRKQALTASAFTREGYRFTGWNTRVDGKGKAFADKQAVTNLLAHDGATGVLYAQWERLPETALPWSGGTMTHNLTTILGGGLLILAIPFVLMRRRRLG
ncbi:InlB B-repeat-containing protein [Bifidobacterium adolescentis]|uniref:InlB B-repeat-containing protein n=1 Tax=Bifidobacterium adolescentis TaxID=1680 RepID=A0A6I0VBC3_BIFAD|nr:InlB B-repeat-containing protein [Bifidobacterium adolescentis]KAB5971853.1 InlB B-repeat-containing protein [Bifidobacterium adolescentis]KAB5973900.1 InlB B-repeat-containing protein [Bifidobacterium adolescentis]KAB5980815.1 InlB B-repeat-containing protein [Bifidobacterium adolescentis]KAB5982579.1 InlB B-repeat-containing protein [Bifidobacterium adolescentis]